MNTIPEVRPDSWNIVLYWPPSNPDVLVFSEIALLLYHSLKSLGHSCRISVNQFSRNSTNILLGYHLVLDPEVFSEFRVVIYQLEQLHEREGVFDSGRQSVLRAANEVWDYSLENLEALAKADINNTRLLPIGFHPHLDCIGSADQDIDVLFYGSMNDRRKKLIETLSRDCTVHYLFRVYAHERDRFIKRSKIILNIHYYEMQIMEQVRISYLLNNGKFVISENSKINPYGDVIVTADYDQLIACCIEYLQDEEKRNLYASKGKEYFSARPMTDYMYDVTEQYKREGLQ